MQEFKNQLARKLSSHKNLQFVIIVNNRLIRTDTYFGLAMFTEDEELILGIKKANTGLQPEPDVERRMANELFRNVYHGVDFSNTQRAVQRRFVINVDPQTRVVDIRTSVHDFALELLNHPDTTASINNVVTGEKDLIDGPKLYTFKRELTLEMIDKYEIAVKDRKSVV